MKKVLHYNWCPFDKNLGGGVSIYIKNLLAYCLKYEKNYKQYYLSSGYSYNPLRKDMYIKHRKSSLGHKLQSYEIVNSDIVGPLGNITQSLKQYFTSRTTSDLLMNFIKEKGPFDIIHIHNIGGIDIGLLELKKYFPDTKFIIDLHNYNLFCINSFLYNKTEEKLCVLGQENCLQCIQSIIISKKLYFDRVRQFWKDNFYTYLQYLLLKKIKKIQVNDNFTYLTSSVSCQELKKYYDVYRKENIIRVNKYFDHVIAVSDRVKLIGIEYGINPKKLLRVYIGTKFADKQKKFKSLKAKEIFTLAYCGYANKIKGFDFLVDALSKLDKKYASKMNLVLAAKGIKIKKIKPLLKNFHNCSFYNGYTHKNLKHILKNVHVGCVPVIWEDNLPQVAIEFVSNGIPIFASNLGGASELTKNKFWCFRSEDTDDLLSKIQKVVDNPGLLDEFWTGFNGLTTMSQHYNFLKEIYER